MQFRVLGPLEASAAGRPLVLGGRKQRTVLALLLLNANEVVPRERLIDALWGDEPPAEADASLRVYVARLRKLLATGTNGRPTLATSANGYVLQVEPEAVDLDRFRRLVGSGEFAHALELWRGPALADLADEDWARRESGLLEEQRLNALEQRIDADLSAGLDTELVPELEQLVTEHPYRERLAAQLMVALYRSGRQPDALDAYKRVANALRETFGLEPTRSLRELERQILAQDPVLERVPRPSRGPPRRPRPSRALQGALLALVVVAALAVTATIVAVARESATPSAGAVPLQGNSVIVIDPETGDVAGEVPLGGRPSGLAVGLGGVWVGNVDDETLLRIDPHTRRVVETIGLGAAPTELAVGRGSVWVLSLEANAVLQVVPAIKEVVASIPLRSLGALAGTGTAQIAFARDAVWVRPGHSGVLLRIDPDTRTVTIARRGATGMASNGRELWAALGLIEASRIQRLFPPGDAIDLGRVGSIPGIRGMAVGPDAVWMATRGAILPRFSKGTLWQIDPVTGRVISSILLQRAVAGVAFSRGAVWVATVDAHVLRVDPNAGRVTKTLPLGVYAPNVTAPIVAADGVVWVAALER